LPIFHLPLTIGGQRTPWRTNAQHRPHITAQIETFTRQIVATVEAAVTQRIQAALADALGVPQKRGPGRPPKQAVARVAPVAARKKQLCPVPGCKNPAAPIFGMVCKDHKNVAKSKIKKYREERREARSRGRLRPSRRRHGK